MYREILVSQATFIWACSLSVCSSYNIGHWGLVGRVPSPGASVLRQSPLYRHTNSDATSR